MTTLKKILIIGEKGSGKLSLLKALTGSLPSDIQTESHGGLTHELKIKNAYYSATIGIWIDEFEADGMDTFCTSYASEEASEVRASLGALVVCFRHNDGQDQISQLLESVRKIADLCPSEMILLAVGTSKANISSIPTSNTTKTSPGSVPADDVPDEAEKKDHWDDLCLDDGFEYIELEAQGKNTFGENTGIKRALDAIEACDWSSTVPDLSEEELLADMMAEDSALNQRLLDADIDEHGVDPSEASVEQLENMMQRVMMAREHLQDLSPEQRKAEAAKLVAEIMRS